MNQLAMPVRRRESGLANNARKILSSSPSVLSLDRPLTASRRADIAVLTRQAAATTPPNARSSIASASVANAVAISSSGTHA